MSINNFPRPARDTGVGAHDTANAWLMPMNLAGALRRDGASLSILDDRQQSLEAARKLELRWRSDKCKSEFLNAMQQPGDGWRVLANRQQFIDDLLHHGFTWYKLLTADDAKMDFAADLVRAGIEVVVRLYSERPHPKDRVPYEIVRAYVQLGARYFEPRMNEPNLEEEWDERLWERLRGQRVKAVTDQFLANADVVLRAGGIPLTPALSPGGHIHHHEFFERFLYWIDQRKKKDVLRQCAIGGHFRPLNHPPDYRDDTGCHANDWEWFRQKVIDFLGEPIPIIETEAGYACGDRSDVTFPEITPQTHADYNLELIKRMNPASSDAYPLDYMARCFWLWDNMGHPAFMSDGWKNNPIHGQGNDLPIVAMLPHQVDWVRGGGLPPPPPPPPPPNPPETNWETLNAKVSRIEELVDISPNNGPMIRVARKCGPVEEIPLEEYLKGVVPREMQASWPQEALRAQAIAARSFAHAALHRPRHKGAGADVCDADHCQVYRESRDARTSVAVDMTAGEVILYDGGIAQAFYSSSCGGRTSFAWNPDAAPWCKPVDCPCDRERVGHGVGLCQYGARAMAVEGKSAGEILTHYYHNITLGRMEV